MMKTKIEFEISTTFSKYLDDGDDVTQQLEERFHDAVHDVFEDFLTGDDIEMSVLDKLDEFLCSAKHPIQEFNKLGGVILSIKEPEILEPYAETKNIIYKNQKKLSI